MANALLKPLMVIRAAPMPESEPSEKCGSVAVKFSFS